MSGTSRYLGGRRRPVILLTPISDKVVSKTGGIADLVHCVFDNATNKTAVLRYD